MSDSDVQAWIVDPSKPAGIAGLVTGSLHYSAGAAEWQPTTETGFWIKPLFEDVSSGTKTLLMKVDPGAWSPMHNHPGELEQIYVLSGTFYDQRGTLKAGDFCCRAPAAAHEAGSLTGAVVLLIYTRPELPARPCA